MSTATISFGEIEFSTNRTLAYAILVSQAAKHFVVAIHRTHEVVDALEKLVVVLTPDRVESLNESQKQWLTGRLQEIHRHLAVFSRSAEAANICALPIPFLSKLVIRLRDLTEDIDDVIEDLVLVSDAEFQGLIAACSASIGLPTGDAGAILHDRHSS